ncbi:hypothetical protein Cgig2_034004 [Carnegiea gigantea]|uniref:Uncharacterized protein n=1 Tax=Carnegiea gigantea TaxID=171969 RepID=A0A9Q1JXG3_9CARY|nr:hypothetical protein Cgig2_034004 [Carnegiea gigantea]
MWSEYQKELLPAGLSRAVLAQKTSIIPRHPGLNFGVREFPKETINWHLRSATRPPQPLPDSYHDWCPYFILPDAEEAARDFRIAELVQATFYVMVFNEALELGVLSRGMAAVLKSALMGQRWFIFEDLTLGQAASVAPPPVFLVLKRKLSIKLARTETTVRLKTIPELMAEGYSAGNSHYASDSYEQTMKVCSTSSSTSERRGEAHSSSSPSLISTTKRACPQKGPSQEVVVKCMYFPRAPEHSNLGDGPSMHFPNPKIVRSLKRPTLDEEYILHVIYKFVIPNPNAMVNGPPPTCTVIHRVALFCGLRFPLH